MLPRIVPVEDEEVSKELLRLFKKQGIRVETGAKVENIQVTDTGVKFKSRWPTGNTRRWRPKRCWSRSDAAR